MKKFGIFLNVVGGIFLVVLSVICIARWYDMKKGCLSYLKLAGDAPTIQKADEFLGKALAYMEKHDLTQGNSAIFFPTPQSDVGIWYSQTKLAKETTARILAKGDPTTELEQLERDNALMKIREVVLDNNKNGTSVTAPANITWYPFQVILFWTWILCAGFFVIGVICLIIYDLRN